MIVQAALGGDAWLVDINPRRVRVQHEGDVSWMVHPTAAYAHMFEAGL